MKDRNDRQNVEDIASIAFGHAQIAQRMSWFRPSSEVAVSLSGTLTNRGAETMPRPLRLNRKEAAASVSDQLPIMLFALSGVIAVVSTVTVFGTVSAQSSRIDFAMSIASLAPVG